MRKTNDKKTEGKRDEPKGETVQSIALKVRTNVRAGALYDWHEDF